jgi:hypothetical protein
MARPISMMSAALVTAAAAGLLPQLIPAQNAAAPVSGSSSASVSSSGGSTPAPAAPAGVGASGNGAGQGGCSPVRIVRPGAGQAIRLDWGGKRAQVRAPLVLRNDSDCLQTVTFEITAQDRLGRCLGVKVLTPNPANLGKRLDSVVTIRAQVNGSLDDLRLPAVGFLKVTSSAMPAPPKPAAAKPGDGKPADVKPADLPPGFYDISIPEPPFPGLMGIVFVSCLAVAAIAVLAVTFVLLRRPAATRINLLSPMGGATWDFQKSWGSNATIAAALLSSILGLFVFPEHPQMMTASSYRWLVGLFAALVVLAPLIYGLFQRDAQVTAANNTAGFASHGYLIMYLLAGGIVFWCALGQAVVLFLLILEFIQGNTVDPLVGYTLEVLAGVLCLLLIIYGVRTLYQVGGRPAAAKPPAPAVGAGAALNAQQIAAQIAAPPPPDWPLL